jgi:hypothetical protein
VWWHLRDPRRDHAAWQDLLAASGLPPDSVRRAMDQVNTAVFGTPANGGEPERTETETETGFGLVNHDDDPNGQSPGGNRSRLGEPSLRSSPPRTYALRDRMGTKRTRALS